MKRSKGFTLIELLVVISIIALLIGILLPALGAARRTARKMKGTTQVRGIVQALVTFADGNKTNFPGVDSRGRIVEDDNSNRSKTGKSGHGATVEARYWILLDRNAFTGEYIISPSETKSEWTTLDVESDNYSYAMLNIDDGSQNYSPVGTPRRMPRPNATGRAREWKANINTQAAMLADRARRDQNDSLYEDIYSVHTSVDSQRWEGSVGWGDGSAGIENEAAQDTKYGNGNRIELDRLFEWAQDTDPNTGFDVIDSNATWDTAKGFDNALLGFAEEGYDITPDVITK